MNPAVDAWAYDMGSPIDVQPVLVGDAVVGISRRGDIAILNAPSGTLLARASIYGGCQADPVAGDGSTATGTRALSMRGADADATMGAGAGSDDGSRSARTAARAASSASAMDRAAETPRCTSSIRGSM